MKNLLSEAAKVLVETGLSKRAHVLELELERLERPKYKVAVIGQFKVGKSTLINKVLIKENLLFTDPLEATAVPTEIEYGPAPGALETYPWKSDSIGVEDAPRCFDSPTPEDIKRETTAETPEGRALKARSIARVRLLWPAESLKGLTIVDTPGVNTTNEAVVNATYRILPEADLTLYVTRGAVLDQIDTGFLRSKVFEAGISRAMIAVNYDPTFGRRSAPQLEEIRSQNRATLIAMGRSGIPVEVVNLTDEIATPEAPAADDAGGAANKEAFESTLIQFIHDNAMPGRMARCKAVLTRELEQARVECEVEIGALQKRPAEIAQIREIIDRKKEGFQKDYQRFTDEYMLDLAVLEADHVRLVSQGLDRISDSYLAGFNNCPGLSAVQNRVNNAEMYLKPELESLMLQVSADITKRLRDLDDKYRGKIANAIKPFLTTVAEQLKIDGGPLARLPYWAAVAIDLVITEILIPFGLITDIVVRLLAKYIPVLRDVVPINLARQLLVWKVTGSVHEEFTEMKQSVQRRLKETYVDARSKAEQAWKDSGLELLAPIVTPLERELDGTDPGRQKKLKGALQAITKLLEAADQSTSF